MFKYSLATFALFASFSASAATDIVASTVCTVETPAKVKATFNVVKFEGDLAQTSTLTIDGKDVPAVRKFCIKQRCPHRHGQEVIELYPRFEKDTNAVSKAELLLWYGPSVNRITLNCAAKK